MGPRAAKGSSVEQHRSQSPVTLRVLLCPNGPLAMPGGAINRHGGQSEFSSRGTNLHIPRADRTAATRRVQATNVIDSLTTTLLATSFVTGTIVGPPQWRETSLSRAANCNAALNT